MSYPKMDGKNSLIKNTTFIKNQIFINMGRPKKETNQKKIKVSISLDRDLYNKIKLDNFKPSHLIQNLIKNFYGN